MRRNVERPRIGEIFNCIDIQNLSKMVENRGQIDPVSAVIGTIVVAIIALLGIYLFSEFNAAITITGPLSGTGEDLLVDGANALVLAVGGTSLAVTAILILKAGTN